MSSPQIFSNLDALAEAIAIRFRKESKQAVKESRLYSVALAGGTTALKVYNLLGVSEFSNTIPWESVHLFWTDERCVSPENNQSNFGTIHRAFLHSIPIPTANLHRIKGEKNPTAEASRYACEIQNHFILRNNSNYFFDWVLLGLGIDGHTASLFPGQDSLLSTTDLCRVAYHPETGEGRITLTPSAFQKAANITYHVISEEKAEIVSELNSQSPTKKKYPAAHVEGEWYLDELAASKLNINTKKI